MLQSRFFDSRKQAMRPPQEVVAAFHALGSDDSAKAYEVVAALAEAIHAESGRLMIVGGCVRDMLRGFASPDIDVEVYGISGERIANVARRFGEVSDIGKLFGILQLKAGDHVIDLAMPRTESKIAVGHKGFSVSADPGLDPTEAARRRDFTVNAIAVDPLTGEIVDPFGGMRDLEGCVLRVVDETTFGDDPLRVLRAVQFAARLALRVDERSFGIMKAMVQSLAELPKERIGGEWRKLLLKAERPSIGMQLAYDLGAIEFLHPELFVMSQTPQEPEWHPEGNVWVHTCMVADQAAMIVRREQLPEDRALIVMLGAVCHDIGKPAVTAVVDGRIRSHGHEDAGVEPTKSFLKKLAIDQDTIAAVVGIVRDHMKPYRMWATEQKGEPITDGAIRRLAKRIHPACMCDFVLVTESDSRGRGPFLDPGDPSKKVFPNEYAAGAWLMKRAAILGVAYQPPDHIIRGAELIELGYPPGPQLGEIIRLADDLRDDKGLEHSAVTELLQAVLSDPKGVRSAAEAIDLLHRKVAS